MFGHTPFVRRDIFVYYFLFVFVFTHCSTRVFQYDPRFPRTKARLVLSFLVHRCSSRAGPRKYKLPLICLFWHSGEAPARMFDVIIFTFLVLLFYLCLSLSGLGLRPKDIYLFMYYYYL